MPVKTAKGIKEIIGSDEFDQFLPVHFSHFLGFGFPAPKKWWGESITYPRKRYWDTHTTKQATPTPFIGVSIWLIILVVS
jgi:hypothetical protein